VPPAKAFVAGRPSLNSHAQSKPKNAGFQGAPAACLHVPGMRVANTFLCTATRTPRLIQHGGRRALSKSGITADDWHPVGASIGAANTCCQCRLCRACDKRRQACWHARIRLRKDAAYRPPLILAARAAC
jgi:hypothetical protein